MDFAGLTSRAHEWLMPSLAILNHEWRGLWSGWLVRLWFVAAGLLALLQIAGNWGRLATAPFIATLLLPFLIFPWFLPVILLGISPVTGARLDALADGILSRPITRYEYLLASWAARVAVVLAIYLAVMVPAVLLLVFAKRPVAPETVTCYGSIAALAVVGLVLTFLVSLGFFAGTLLGQPLLAASILSLAWIPILLVPYSFSWEEFSPLSLNQALPTLLRTPWHQAETVDAQSTAADMQVAAEQAAQFLRVLSGGSDAKPDPGFYARGSYEDFSLLRVLLGYGMPTLLALGLATWVFSRRDL